MANLSNEQVVAEPKSAHVCTCGYCPFKKPYLRLQAAAVFLGVHPTTLRRWTDEGKVKAVRIGTRGDRQYKVIDLLEIKGLYEDSLEKIENALR